MSAVLQPCTKPKTDGKEIKRHLVSLHIEKCSHSCNKYQRFFSTEHNSKYTREEIQERMMLVWNKT